MPDAELLFIGGTYGPEGGMAQKAGITFVGLPGRGMLGRGARAIPAAWDNLKAVALAIAKEREFGPCVVAAFGGYASFAPAVAALAIGIPLLLHEQNAVAGASNKLLSRFAKKVCLSLPDTERLKGDCILTGNPVRNDISRSAQRRMPGKKLLVLGGSQGAHALNKQMIAMLPALAKANVEILHQTGPKDYEMCRAAYVEAGYSGDCARAFIDDMASAYAWANLILCRSGASTVAELCIAELPSIMVPFPAAIRDHQTKNAKAMAEAGGAVLVPEPEIQSVENLIIKMLDDRGMLSRMSRACASLARPDAATRVAREIEKLCMDKANR